MLLVLALVAIIVLWPKPCEQFGGRMLGGSQSWSCQCYGVKVTTRNDAPVDGFTIKPCIGIALHHHCSKWDGVRRAGEVLTIPCDQK